jgi:hypothetical protein
MTRRMIKDEWTKFARMVLPEPCDEIQHDEMERAFYSGCTILFEILCEDTDPGPTATKADNEYFNGLARELTAFMQSRIAKDQAEPRPIIVMPHIIPSSSPYESLTDIPDTEAVLNEPLPDDSAELLAHLIRMADRVIGSLTAVRNRAATASTWRDLQSISKLVDTITIDLPGTTPSGVIQ